jgi:CDP-glycerol glycerophosphotransferase (TagB/SpsB family)
MEKLHIQKTDETPEVIFDPANNTFEMSGKSLPEDVTDFFDKVVSWLEEYAQNPNEETVFNFKLTYFNTATAKLIFDILNALEEILEKDKKIVVKWHYPEKDEDMKEAGKEYDELVELDFEHIPYAIS